MKLKALLLTIFELCVCIIGIQPTQKIHRVSRSVTCPQFPFSPRSSQSFVSLGPNAEAVDNFLLMVWRLKVKCIVMINQVFESGRVSIWCIFNDFDLWKAKSKTQLAFIVWGNSLTLSWRFTIFVRLLVFLYKIRNNDIWQMITITKMRLFKKRELLTSKWQIYSAIAALMESLWHLFAWANQPYPSWVKDSC